MSFPQGYSSYPSYPGYPAYPSFNAPPVQAPISSPMGGMGGFPSIGNNMPGGGNLGFDTASFSSPGGVGAGGGIPGGGSNGGGAPSQAEIDAMLSQIMSSMGGGGAPGGIPGMPGGSGGAPGAGGMVLMPDGSVQEMNGGSSGGGGLLSTILRPRNLLLLAAGAALAIWQGPKLYRKFFQKHVEAITKSPLQEARDAISQFADRHATRVSELQDAVSKGEKDRIGQLRQAVLDELKKMGDQNSQFRAGETRKNVETAWTGAVESQTKLYDSAEGLAGKSGAVLDEGLVTKAKAALDEVKKLFGEIS